jgi:hypothetical protein
MQHLHGKKGKALVHVGAVDAPVTIDEINACLAECQALRQTELHVLGWEWEMGLANLMIEDAKRRGVKLVLLTIPREVMEQQAVDKGDIQFFELAYLEVDIKTGRDARLRAPTATVILKDFIIPNTELIPEEVRTKVHKRSDYIDYWAVDCNFQNDTFMNGWVAYRTRKDRTLPLQCDRHSYNKPGTYAIMVKRRPARRPLPVARLLGHAEGPERYIFPLEHLRSPTGSGGGGSHRQSPSDRPSGQAPGPRRRDPR